ncbi:MAG TPA: AAA family ATPase [Acidimicrobiales bacterium]
MITRVLLRHWRGYEKLSLDFGPGLTFVIADNGVGKTSLVNGVAWAIFGDDAGVDADAAIRAGTDEASAEVDLVVGDATVSLTRTLRRHAPRGRSRQTLQVLVDGQEVEGGRGAQVLRDLLGEVAGVPLDIVPQLLFVPEMRLTHEGELFADVQEHLAALLGIDDLRRAARTLRTVQADAARDVRALQQAGRVDQAALDRLAVAIDEVRVELERLDAALAAAREERAGLEDVARRQREWAVHDQRQARHEARLAELTGELRSVGIEPEPDELAEAVVRAGTEAHELHADLVAARTEAELVTGLVEQLEGAEATCPLCLQALDEATADHAAEQHRARLAELAERQAATERRRRAVDAAAAKLRSLADELARQRPPEPPEHPRPEEDEADVQARLAELDRHRAELLDRRGALGERLRRAEAALAEARRTAEADAALERAHATVASASALAALTEGEADARTERALEPISRAIAARWAEFFVASASRPRLAGGGSIELGERGGVSIPYSSFSGGEKTLASLLTRLLFVTAATGLRSMWLDEPLEHLDPANRTRVARLLAQVTQPGSHLRQLVVTTYEEGLARSMVGRHEGTEVVYVSTDALL